MLQLIVESQEGKKSRSFQSACLAVAIANTLLPESNGKTIRPIWAMFAGTESELRPFIANVRLGRKAETLTNYRGRRGSDSERLEFLKGVSYEVSWQREAEGCVVTMYHPDLFRLDPGMVDPSQISFVMLVPEDWAAEQQVDARAAVRYVKGLGCQLNEDALALLVPTAYLFTAYLDRRTLSPLITDGRFYLQLLCAALKEGLASFPGTDLRYPYQAGHEWGHSRRHGFNMASTIGYGAEFNPSQLGFRHAISFHTSHSAFEEFLAEQVSIYFAHQDKEVFRSIASRVDLGAFLQDA